MRNQDFSISRLAFLFVAFLASTSCTMRTDPGKEILRTLPEPVSYKAITPEEWKLPNGLTVLYYEDNELPLVTGTLYIRGGSLWEPLDSMGAVSAMGSQMRQGGAGDLDADDLDKELEKLAAGVDSNFGGEWGTVSFGSLNTDFDRVFSIFADVLLRPRFDKDRFELWKGQMVEGIRRRVDDPDTVASVAFGQLLYGNTPYGRVLVENDIKKLARLDLLRMHRLFVRPNEAILTVVGSIKRPQLEKAISEKLSGWEPRSSELGDAPVVDFQPQPGIYFVELPFTQTTLQAGHLGVKRLSPDHIAISAFNEVFGSGGFESLLMKRIRSDLGLVYGIYGAVVPGVDKGRNLIYLKTKSETTVQALTESVKVLDNIKENAVPDEDLQEVKRHVQNSFVFQFESPGSVLARKAQLRLMEYPENYDDTFVDRVLALETDDMQRIAQKHWDPSKFVIVVVGNESAYNSLEKLMENPPEYLRGMNLRKLPFNQKLVQ